MQLIKYVGRVKQCVDVLLIKEEVRQDLYKQAGLA
jgi:hypothetical protein